MSITTSNRTKAVTLARVQALIAGTQQHFPNGSFTFGNVVHSASSLVQAFQDLVQAMNAESAARSSAKDALVALRTAKAAANPLIMGYRRLLVSMFAGATQLLADLGLEPPKARKPRTSAENAAAAAKAMSTRKARGTASKKQKLAIKGDVKGIQVVPITSPASASPSPQPAPAAPSAPTTGASK